MPRRSRVKKIRAARRVDYCHATRKPKVIHATRQVAQMKAARRMRLATVELSVYKCRHCRGWHLTSYT